MSPIRRFSRVLAFVLFRPFIRLRVENPPDPANLGAVILAPNHTSYLDPAVLQIAVGRHLTFLMTELVYRIRWVRWFFRFWGTIPVGEQRATAGNSIRLALRAIAEGRTVVIFPEGRISEDGCLNEGRGGVVLLVLKAQVPVIPVAILGTYDVLPKRARLPRRGTVTIRFGEPLRPPAGALIEARLFAAEIMDRLHALGAPRRERDASFEDERSQS